MKLLKSPKGESDGVPQVCDTIADVKQVTKTPDRQQLSDAPKPAVQVVTDQDDAAQSAQPETADQAGDAPSEQYTWTKNHSMRHNLWCNRFQKTASREQRELERIQFEKEAKRRLRRARAPKSSTARMRIAPPSSVTLLCFQLRRPRGNRRTAGLQPAVTYAAPVPVIENVSPVSAVYAATVQVNEGAAPALLICRRVR